MELFGGGGGGGHAPGFVVKFGQFGSHLLKEDQLACPHMNSWWATIWKVFRSVGGGLVLPGQPCIQPKYVLRKAEGSLDSMENNDRMKEHAGPLCQFLCHNCQSAEKA